MYYIDFISYCTDTYVSKQDTTVDEFHLGNSRKKCSVRIYVRKKCFSTIFSTFMYADLILDHRSSTELNFDFCFWLALGFADHMYYDGVGPMEGGYEECC